MKYGDVVEKTCWQYKNGSLMPMLMKYKFRHDPVPGTGISHYGSIIRHMRTTQERRMNCAHKEYVRGKRSKLPHTWDDHWVHRNDISWKKCTKKRKQWM